MRPAAGGTYQSLLGLPPPRVLFSPGQVVKKEVKTGRVATLIVAQLGRVFPDHGDSHGNVSIFSVVFFPQRNICVSL